MNYLTEPRLEEIFRQVLQLGSGREVSELEQSDVPEWDSLAHVSLILAIEEEFGVQVDAADAIELTSYDAVARFLESHGA
ncbi:MAG TPA: acyl carrier protein [Gemmatimonadaceae bacterium]